MPAVLPVFQADPLRFGRSVLGRTRWAKQEEIRRAIFEHRRVHMRSANSVGKTHELASTILEWISRRKRRRVLCTGPTHHTIKRGLWSEIRQAYFEARRLGNELGGFMGKEDWILGDSWDAAIVSVDNPSAAQGARGVETMIVIDEAQGVQDPELWSAFESLMTDPGSRMVQSGNPLSPMGPYYECTIGPGSEQWHKIQISGFDHPNVGCAPLPMSEMTPEWIAAGRQIIPGSISRLWIYEKADAWGEDDPRYVARVLGEFPDEGERQLITLRNLEDCANRGEDGRAKVKIHRCAGLDVAISPTGDKNVFKIFDEHRTQIYTESWRGYNPSDTCGRLIRACEKHGIPREKARHVGVDVCGVGGVIVQLLKEKGWYVNPVDFGAPPKGSWWATLGEDAKYLNLKAELHDLARYYFRHGMIEVPRTDRETWADLTALSYGFDGSGNMRIDPKDKIRSEIGRSPDHSDAVMIAIADRGALPVMG